MSTESKSAGGFWIKVIFWLLIIVLGFIYIRSLAKHPADEASTETSSEASQEVVATAPEAAGSTGGGVAEVSDETAAAESEDTRTESESALATTQPVAAPEPAPESRQQPGTEAEADAGKAAVPTFSGQAAASATPEQAASGEPASETPVPEEGMAEATGDMPPAGVATTDSGSVQSEQKTMRNVHDESVAKILEEFDDLREAARAEMEAMRNRMEAERDLRDAMMAPRPRTYPPSGYGPYAPPRQYNPPY